MISQGSMFINRGLQFEQILCGTGSHGKELSK